MQRDEIVNARQLLNLSLEELRDITEVSIGTLSRFENGYKVKKPIAVRICAALHVPLLDEYVVPRRLKKVREGGR